MKGKLFLYVIVTFIVAWAMDSLNINHLFKKDHILKAQILYFLIGISIIYFVTNFLMDLFTLINFF